MNRRHARYPRLRSLAQSLLVVLLLAAGLTPLTWFSRQSAAQSTAGAGADLAPATGLLFIENVGQFPAAARFRALGGPQGVWLAEDSIWLTFLQPPEAAPTAARFPRGGRSWEADPPSPARTRGARVKLSFVDANPRPQMQPVERLAARVSYFYGDDPAGWRAEAPVWGGVRYVDLYPGVDLEIAGLGASWQWQLTCRADCRSVLQAVRLRVEGAGDLFLEGDRLRVVAAVGETALPLLRIAPGHAAAAPRPAPAARRVDAQRFDVYAPFTGADLGHPAPRIPGPSASANSPAAAGAPYALAYATYLGGHFRDIGRDMAVDSAGNLYLAGATGSPDFPATPDAYGEFFFGGDYDVFVAKLNRAGSALLYATFIGGVGDDRGDDIGYGLAVDAAGAAYVTGWTNSGKFPTTAGAYDTSFNGAQDLFALKLNASGNDLLYATYLGGSQAEKSADIAVDSAGNAYITGWTSSLDFPVVAAAAGFDAYHGGVADLFIAKLNRAGAALDYSMYIGGRDEEAGYALAVSRYDDVWVTGYTFSTNFPTKLAFDHSLNEADAFVLYVQATDGSLGFSSFLGGSGDELAYDIVLDAAGYAYVVGATDSTDFPVTAGAADTSYNGGYVDAFVAKLHRRGLGLIYATYLGYGGYEQGYAIAVDGAGSACVTGVMGDDVATRISAAGDAATPLFTAASFTGEGLAADGTAGVYVLGYSSSNTLPTTPGAFDTSANGDTDIWAAKLVAPLYIFGRVSDATGRGLAGVGISAGDPYQAISDAGGRYTLTVPAGVYTFAPTTAGYFWSPASHTAALPPNANGYDFTGAHIRKQLTAAGVGQPAAYGDVLTYTVSAVHADNPTLLVYDRAPTHTVYVAGSLVAAWPWKVAYDPLADAISGTLQFYNTAPITMSFAVRVAVTGTLGAAPLIVNRACLRPQGGGLDACEWSNPVHKFTYSLPLYLPLIAR